ncbi:uncharacterized protein HMPREF1541_05451 [Cyphellophora europaea CBS 101466]|uniref:N-acetyltransferase domain-containing protein n=1 Tax=Cyphellophora europaea (strain CBS 101466) TaxID=1220924 RepID=W2RTY2_CYPE1|nr:uncharacterized protein HMPREF1541_05451 [Cyphellophora europaea CBS 101466]ETN39228.1 hypothetical protein HMPREF1541_05451 [Cyphellophora europaea CBS 101466]
MARPSSSSSLSDTTRSSSRDSARSSCAATASFSSPQPPSPPSQQQQQQQQQQPPTICYRIRKATPDDIPYLPDVERSAGEVFRSIEGLESLADDDPMPEEVLRCYAEAGWVWVATVAWDDRRNGGKNEEEEENESVQEVVGFLACFPIVSQRRQAQVQPQQLPTPQRPEAEGTESETQAYLHIAELSVHASHQKRGLGGRLLDTMFVEVAEGPVVSCATIAVGGGEEEQGDDEEALSQRQGQACDAEHGGEGARGLGSDEDGGEDEAETEGETLGTQRGWRARRRVKARIRGYSLTTYRHLSFNRPFYERIGFREVSVGDIEGVVGARGRELWEQEQRSIVLRETRCWMVRALS